MMSKLFVLAAVSMAPAVATTTKYYNPQEPCSDPAICVGGGLVDNRYCKWNNKPIEGRCYIPKCNPNGAPDGMKECTADWFTGASLGVTGTTIHENMPGWQDIPKSRLFNFPDSLLGRHGLVPSAYTEANHVFELDCPGRPGGECDLFVFLYRCPPCMFKDGGNLAATLLANDWLPYSCDVRFKLDPSGHEHSTIVYHKQIPTGDFVDVIPTEVLELAWFSRGPATAHCDDFKDEHTCNTEQPDECHWKDGTCSRVMCPTHTKPPTPPSPGTGGPGNGKPKGPWTPKCTTCLDNERHFMPTLMV